VKTDSFRSLRPPCTYCWRSPTKIDVVTKSCRRVLSSRWAHYKIGPGTLYDNLQKSLDSGLVIESRFATIGVALRLLIDYLCRLSA
jgi:hypothetical protein